MHLIVNIWFGARCSVSSNGAYDIGGIAAIFIAQTFMEFSYLDQRRAPTDLRGCSCRFYSNLFIIV